MAKRSLQTEDSSTPLKLERALDDGDILGLEVMVGGSNNDISILVSYTSGRVAAISSDLQRTRGFLPSNTEEGTLEHTSVVASDAAAKGLLRSREDILKSTDLSKSTLLFTVARRGHERVLRLYGGRASAGAGLQTSEPSHRLLLDHVLPQDEGLASAPASFDLHAASARLSQLGNQRLCIYDLSGTLPKVITRLGNATAPVTAFARISPTLTMTSGNNAIALYETKYGSLYSELPLSDGHIPASKKRKLENRDLGSANILEQVCCVADRGPVVTLRGQYLVVFQLAETFRSSKRARSQNIRLADIVRRNHTGITPLQQNRGLESSFKDWASTIDELVETDDAAELEGLVATDPTLGQQRDPNLPNHDGVNGNKIAYDELWPLPEPSDGSRLDRRKALYILGSVFSSTKDGVAIQILSLKLLEWLALTGLLSSSQIKKAWSTMHQAHATPNEGQIQPGDIMFALQPYDEDFQLSRNLLSLPVQWEIEEVIEVLRSIVQSFEEPAQGENGQLFLPPVPQQRNDDSLPINGEDTPNELAGGGSDIEMEAEAAEQELDHALSALSNGLEVRSDTLRIIFSRLLAFNSQTVTMKLREIMSDGELVFFIHVLRIELADGGWTSRYVGTGNNDESEEQGMVNAMEGAEEGGPSNGALRTIGDLLNCAVDALGVSGWLIGLGSNSVTAKELLTNLRAEVSAGLEQCYEADTLGSALRVLEGFAEEVEKEHTSEKAGGIDEGSEGDETKLPMGGRLRPVVVGGRNGGGAKKSRIARAQEKSRRVGKYSFDRIRI